MTSNAPNSASRQVIIYEKPSGEMPYLASEMESESQGGLGAYWYVLVRHRWTIVAVATGCALVVAVISFFIKPVYRATARLEIEPETPLLQSVADIYQKVEADDPFIQTQIQVLKGPSVAWETIRQLHLEPTLGVMLGSALTEEQIENHKLELIQAFQNNLTAELLPKTRILSVGYDDGDPKTSALISTTVANVYLDHNFREKYEAIRRSGWMEQQLQELKGNVEQSQQAVVDYEQQHQIANTSDKQNVLSQMLSDLSHDLTTAKSDRIQKQSLFLQAEGNRSQLASLVHDELLQKLEERAAELKELHAAMVAQYGPNFPKVTRLDPQLAEQQKLIEREQNRILDRMRNDYKAARDRENLAAAAVGHQKDEVARLNHLMVQDNMLRHEFETNQQLYQSLLQRLKDATVSAGLRSTSIHLVDNALPPVLPIRPRKALYTVCALFAGLFLGMVTAFTKDRLDSSIRTAEEAEALAVSPALGVIPFERGVKMAVRPQLRTREPHPLALTLTRRPHSSLSEAFRALGTAVLLPANQPKTLLVTSAQNGEGKTVTALNLAQTLAQRRGPVVVVDCDLRRAGIAEALQIRNDKGVSTVLSGEHEINEALQPCTAQSNLWIMPSGPAALYPAELLASQRMSTLLEQLASRFATVIIDSPPVLAVTDPTILSTLVDGVLVVTASGGTPRAGLVRTRRILNNAGARILGLAVNKLDPRFQSYRYYGYFYAGSVSKKTASLMAS